MLASVHDLRVFLSYRRADSAAYAGRLFDALSVPERRLDVFRDVNTIKYGENFVAAVEAAVDGCDVAIALIGPSWLGTIVERLDSDADYVRLELEAALGKEGIHILPVLVGGAVMPRAEDLPPSLQPLTRINAIPLADDPRWHGDVQSLADVLEEMRRAKFGESAGTSLSTRASDFPRIRPRDTAGGSRAWHAAVASGEVLIIRALGSDLVVAPFGSPADQGDRRLMRAPLRALVAPPEGGLLAIETATERLLVAAVTPEGRLLEWESRFSVPHAGARLAAARRAGRGVELLLRNGAAATRMLINRSGSAPSLTEAPGIWPAAGTDDGFVGIGADGLLSGGARLFPFFEPGVQCVDLDLASGGGTVLTAALARYADGDALHLTRIDAFGSTRADIALASRCERAVVVRPTATHAQPSDVVVESGAQLLAWSWRDIAPA
jgi:hypothetical protein